MTIKIEHAVPVPDYTGMYPFDSMKIGDSFEIPKSSRGSVATKASFYARIHPGYKFTVRKVGDKVRVWRIAAANGKGKA